MKGWLNDIGIGVRLAVGGGRTSLARFALSAVGVAIAVAVLLLAASVGPVLDSREHRRLAGTPNTEPVAGATATQFTRSGTEYAGRRVNEFYLHGLGPGAPVPPGIPRLPAEDEGFVSPALADLLADPANGLLRERLPQRIAGVIDESAIESPRDLSVYGSAGFVTSDATVEVYSFGAPASPGEPMDPGLLLLLLLGTVALLVPVFIFVVSSTRIAGAERDRRLSALRLVGADTRQVRRLAAAETLVSALAGLVLGAGLFLAGRELAIGVELLGTSVFPSDIVPVWWLAALVVLAIPVLAVLAAQFALRRTIIEPLGVVRHGKPIRRRFGWRLGVVSLGVLLLVWHGGSDSSSQLWSYSVATGATLVLLGVPILLPFVLERAVGGLRGGPSSWQLAIRRLQLDSGTSARVVGGVAVVLAGAIALQSVLLSQAAALKVPEEVRQSQQPVMRVYPSAGATTEALALLRAAPGDLDITEYRQVEVRFVGGASAPPLVIAACPAIQRLHGVPDCVDGEVFAASWDDLARNGFRPGRDVEVVSYQGGERPDRVLDWRLPATHRALPPPADPANSTITAAGMVVTPGAIPQLTDADGATTIEVRIDPNDPAAADRVRNAVHPLRWRVSSYVDTPVRLTSGQQSYVTIRQGLLLGSVFTLLLAGISLLVLALEHIRERRRPLAILAASGVPTGALARSLLWQIAVPLALGVVVAVATGIGLAALVTDLSVDPLVVDWGGVALLAGAAAVLGVLVSLVTLPFLRSATRLNSLRTE